MDAALVALEGGACFRGVLEELLHGLSPEMADRLMQLLREARGAWVPLLRGPRGRALFVGNALSGVTVPLAFCGYDVTVVDASEERLRFGWHRTQAQAPDRSCGVLHDDATHLPFPDGCFDLAVLDATGGGAVARARDAGADEELRRVSRAEIVRLGDNRLGYKRSLGRRGVFRVPRPLEYARRALRPPQGERTLWGQRRALQAADFEPARAYALYPHSGEFALVVGLDGDGPRLQVGPMERRNRLKTVAHGLGLFPVFTPSFALFGARRAAALAAPTRLDRVLCALAERTGEPQPLVDQLVATRDNAAVVFTRPARTARDEGAPGSWVLRIALGNHQIGQIPRHAELLRRLPQVAAGVPVPELLFHGELEGLELCCERRLGGWTAPQYSGDRARVRRMLADAAQHLALLCGPPEPLDEASFERIFGAKVDLVARGVRASSALTWLDRLRAELAEELIGRPMPRALCHGDLRAKHVQLDDAGRVLGYLDWGSAADDDVPYYDLLHLIVHERKQEAGCSSGEAWRAVCGRRELRDHESAALDAYTRAVGLDEGLRAALERAYPVFVANVAESNWDYSRPHWLRQQFGL